MSRSSLSSWGRFPPFPQTAHAVHWRSDIASLVKDVTGRFGTTLAYGRGRSYGDSCLASSDHVVHTSALDRFVAADWTKGLIVAESGVTLEQMLALCVRRGWFPPVLPGTQQVTLGGALANDIHGKNHHVRGTIGRHITRFGLLRSDRGELQCSPEENPELFQATLGGLGLTGIVTWVELRLIPVRGSRMRVADRRFGSLEEFFSLSAELDPKHEYAVSWLDCLATGSKTGRGIYTVADHADDDPPAGAAPDAPSPVRLGVPFTPPVSLVNPIGLRLFNSLYYGLGARRPSPRQQHYEPFFFPLDRIARWNRLYGPKGFQQYQCVLPDEVAPLATRDLLKAIAASGRGSFLAVMKRCGSLGSPGLMSFPLPGVSVALDFPQHPQLAQRLFPTLDGIVREASGRLYPAKDAHMSGDDFRRGYPHWQTLEALRDPALCSRFWQRVTTR